MNIHNKGNYFTNEQLYRIVHAAGKEYSPKRLVVCETRKDVLFAAHLLGLLRIIGALRGNIEGVYMPLFDAVAVFIFSENDDGDDKHSKQLYSIHALMHELRHRYQFMNCKKMSEEDADKYASGFVNKRSDLISKIMNWKEEWKVEEE